MPFLQHVEPRPAIGPAADAHAACAVAAVEHSERTAENSGRCRCSCVHPIAGGPGFLRKTSCCPLVISGKNSKNSGKCGFCLSRAPSEAAGCLLPEIPQPRLALRDRRRLSIQDYPHPAKRRRVNVGTNNLVTPAKAGAHGRHGSWPSPGRQ